jgi:hypothetical protein
MSGPVWVIVGTVVLVAAMAGVDRLMTWSTRQAGPPVVCDHCEEVVDSVAPYEFAGPGRHSPRNVCDPCFWKLIRGDAFDESPGFGRHADEALAVVRKEDDDLEAMASELNSYAAMGVTLNDLVDADLDDPNHDCDKRGCPGLYGAVAGNYFHPAGSCDACDEGLADDRHRSIAETDAEFQAARAKPNGDTTP